MLSVPVFVYLWSVFRPQSRNLIDYLNNHFIVKHKISFKGIIFPITDGRSRQSKIDKSINEKILPGLIGLLVPIGLKLLAPFVPSIFKRQMQLNYWFRSNFNTNINYSIFFTIKPALSATESLSTPVIKIPRLYSTPPRIISPKLCPGSMHKSTWK